MIISLFFIVVLVMYSIIVYCYSHTLLIDIVYLYDQLMLHKCTLTKTVSMCIQAVVYNIFVYIMFFIYAPIEAVKQKSQNKL